MTLHSIGPRTAAKVRKWLTALFCLVTCVAGHAAMNEDGTLTASKVFAEAPLEVLDMLRPTTRLDMLDYWTQADSVLTATNALGGESRLVKVAPDYIKAEITPVSILEIKIIPAGKRQVVMTLYTVGDAGMAQDTEVRFFDPQLRPLDTRKYLKAPLLEDFFSLKGSGLDAEDLREKAPYAAVAYSTGPGDTPLTATLTTLRVISQEDRDLLTSLFTPTLTANWKGKYDF